MGLVGIAENRNVDELGGRPIAVSYCPLTGSGMVYDPAIGGQTLITLASTTSGYVGTFNIGLQIG